MTADGGATWTGRSDRRVTGRSHVRFGASFADGSATLVTGTNDVASFQASKPLTLTALGRGDPLGFSFVDPKNGWFGFSTTTCIGKTKCVTNEKLVTTHDGGTTVVPLAL